MPLPFFGKGEEGESKPAEGGSKEAAAATEATSTEGGGWRISRIWGGSEKEEKNELCPTLSFQQRVYAFAGCLLLGLFFSILSWMSLFHRKWTHFGILVTLGNVTSIGSSMFLAGPKKQAKKMFEETRYIATCVYFVCMILTLVAAFAVKSAPLVILMTIIQYLAMIWYGLSYIPYARTVVKSCCKSVV